MLLNRHGDALLRIKGTLNVADAATPVAVEAVRYLVHTPRHLEAWPDADRLSRLVFIARGGVRNDGMPPGRRPSGRASGVFCPLLYIWCFPPTL